MPTFVVPVVDAFLSSKPPRSPLVDWNAFEEWESSLPMTKPNHSSHNHPSPTVSYSALSKPGNRRSSLILPAVERLNTTPNPIQPVISDWFDESAIWRGWSFQEKEAENAARAAADRLVKRIEAALEEEEKKAAIEKERNLEEERRLKAEESKRLKEIEQLEDKRTDQLEDRVMYLRAKVAAGRAERAAAAENPPTPDFVTKMAAAFESELVTGADLRKTIPAARDLWKEAALSVGTLAGTLNSIIKSTKRLSDVLTQAKAVQTPNHSVTVFSWLSAVAADKLVAQCNIHTKQLVWSVAYFSKQVGSMHPEFITNSLMGAIAKRQPGVLSPVCTAKRSDSEYKDMEILVRLLLAILCVCGDSKGLFGWIKGVFRTGFGNVMPRVVWKSCGQWSCDVSLHHRGLWM